MNLWRFIEMCFFSFAGLLIAHAGQYWALPLLLPFVAWMSVLDMRNE